MLKVLECFIKFNLNIMADPNAAQVDADGNPIEPLPSNIDEEMAEDMAKIWKVFSNEDGEAPVMEL